ncbi:MAG: M1 family peptidase, partial [Gemmatimonadales bacterium]
MNGMIRFGLILTLAACGGARQTQLPPVTATPSRPIAAPERPVPYPVVPPPSFRGAVDRGTRTTTGVPGESYWQQWADYEIDVRIDPAAHTISGTETVIYRNNSTDRLPQIFVHLYQNLHAPGAIRNESQEITGGIELLRVNADGHNSNYVVNGTHMAITLPAPLESGDTTTLQFTWRFQIPQSGAGRMGWNGDNLLYVGYWYPQVAVYDDVAGWHIDPYLGNAEFHNAFANYEYTVHAPDGWLVMGTGELTNAADALAPAVLERVRLAEISDDVVHVVTEADFGAVTAHSANGWVSWSFAADSVRDVAFSVTRASNWDAMRTPVGDVDGDGTADHARVDAIWRNSAPRWAQQVEYSRHSITFLSRYTGIPYPWPHMTAVEGGGIIGGG